MLAEEGVTTTASLFCRLPTPFVMVSTYLDPAQIELDSLSSVYCTGIVISVWVLEGYVIHCDTVTKLLL